MTEVTVVVYCLQKICELFQVDLLVLNFVLDCKDGKLIYDVSCGMENNEVFRCIIFRKV